MTGAQWLVLNKKEEEEEEGLDFDLFSRLALFRTTLASQKPVPTSRRKGHRLFKLLMKSTFAPLFRSLSLSVVLQIWQGTA